MWPFRPQQERQITLSKEGAAAIILAVLSFAIAGIASYTAWSLFDEQVRLRKDFVELGERQQQVEIQYEYWLRRLQDERTRTQAK